MDNLPTTKKVQFGGLPPEYSFVLNPYPKQRHTRCPFCDEKTGQRKLPLLIHVDPSQLIALNYTCRYCKHCDLLIGHKHEIEHLLHSMFKRYDPTAIGNDYMILGTLEKKTWREGMKQTKAIAEMLPQVSDFEVYYEELRMSQPGWYNSDQEPPIMEPPPSQEWVKIKPNPRIRRRRRKG